MAVLDVGPCPGLADLKDVGRERGGLGEPFTRLQHLISQRWFDLKGRVSTIVDGLLRCGHILAACVRPVMKRTQLPLFGTRRTGARSYEWRLVAARIYNRMRVSLLGSNTKLRTYIHSGIV
jgi:hypothetical protein